MNIKKILRKINFAGFALAIIMVVIPFVFEPLESSASSNLLERIYFLLSSSGWGYELPKVRAVTLFCTLVILFFGNLAIFKYIKNSAKDKLLKSFLFLIPNIAFGVLTLFFTGNIFEYYQKYIPNSTFWNLFLAFIIFNIGFLIAFSVFRLCVEFLISEKYFIKPLYLIAIFTSTALVFSTAILPEEFKTTSIYGNYFREQGLIFYLLLIWALVLLYNNLTRGGINLILKAVLISGVIQATVGIIQYLYLQQNMPELLNKGEYINGTFGQANFYSGFLMVSTLIGIYYFFNSVGKRKKILAIISLALLVISLKLSYSDWGIISTLFGILLIFTYEISKKVKLKGFFPTALALILVSSTIIFLFVTNNISNINELYHLRFRADITLGISAIFFGSASILQFLFGYGFDTLRIVFEKFGYEAMTRVDRAHNIFMDVLAQNGFLAFLAFIIFIIWVFKIISKSKNNILLTYLGLVIFSWIFRSSVSESGVVNLLQAGIIIVLFLKLHSLDRIDTQKR